MIELRTFEVYLAIIMVVQVMAFFSMLFLFLMPLVVISIIAGLIIYQEIGKFRYPISVVVFVKRKSGFSIAFDQATRKFMTGTKNAYYWLRKAKKPIKPTDFGYIIETKKGLFNVLYSPSPDEYAPITEINEGELKVMDEDMKMWYAQAVKKSYERFHREQSKWQQYYPIVSVAVLGIVFAIILYANSTYMTGVTAQLSSAAGTLAEAVKGFSAVVGGSSGFVPPH